MAEAPHVAMPAHWDLNVVMVRFPFRTEISVTNQGAPIAPEHLPRLFDRFYRCDPARAQPGDSGGLGLAIVRSIMQMHGGSVRVDSGASGTRFVLVFPQRG